MNVKPLRVAMCYPNFSWTQDGFSDWNTFPHSLCILAAVIRDFCEVEIIDSAREALSQEAFADRIAQGGYDVIGISVPMDVFATAGHLAVSLARKAAPKSTVVMGGVYPTMNPAQAVSDINLDYAILGEGEEVFPALLRHLGDGGPLPESGLAFRKDGTPVIQTRSRFIENLDALPFPAYDLIDFSSYANWFSSKSMNRPLLFPYAEILSSRGCPQNCCFCQVIHISGRKLRPRSADNVLDEIAFLRERYDVKSLLFTDDNIVAIRQRAMDLFTGMCDRKLAMPWKAVAMAVFRLDKELIDAMVASGCQNMNISIESGNPRVLKEIINKPINLEHAKKMTAYARSQGMFVSANFVIGMPGETWEEIRDSFRYAEELGADYIRFVPAIPLRHTRLWEICETSNAFMDGFDPNDALWYKGYIKSPHFDSKEITLLAAYEWDRINFSSPERTHRIANVLGACMDEVQEMRRETRRRALNRIIMDVNE